MPSTAHRTSGFGALALTGLCCLILVLAEWNPWNHRLFHHDMFWALVPAALIAGGAGLILLAIGRPRLPAQVAGLVIGPLAVGTGLLVGYVLVVLTTMPAGDIKVRSTVDSPFGSHRLVLIGGTTIPVDTRYTVWLRDGDGLTAQAIEVGSYVEVSKVTMRFTGPRGIEVDADGSVRRWRFDGESLDLHRLG
ncbi:hypothetical protein [Actinomadura sp. 9N407]|uniref:hypothetical protein n=1 Tax=Actinomadura sp. 9N407 TaxID=3375154 RepID=UPI00378A6A5A